MADVAVFVSYSHDDNDATYGRILQISNDVRRLYKSLSGLEVELFIDTEAISLGEQWRDRIRSGLTNASILLAFVSPLYLGSTFCREEFQGFIWTASEAGARKLIIPLLFTPVTNIENRFQNDELWAQVIELQHLEIHQLRRSDPGAGQWMDKVETVAERMISVLNIPDLQVPPPTGPIETEKPTAPEPGTLEQLKNFEQSMQPFNETIQDVARLIGEFNDRVVAATAPMAAAETFTGKLEVADRLADELIPITDKFSGRVQDFQRYLNIVDPGIRAMFKLHRSNPTAQQTQEAREFVESTKTLAETSLNSMTSMTEFYESIDGSKGFSSKLDSPLHRMQSSILIMAGNRGIFKDWLAEAENLSLDNESDYKS